MSGTKHDGNKPRPELLSPDALLAIAEVLAFGAKKYDAHNWRKGFEWSRLLGAAQRHLLAFQAGEDKDPESGLPHLAHLGCCVMFLIEHQTRGLGTDDRYKQPAPSKKEFTNPPLCEDDDPTVRFEPRTLQQLAETYRVNRQLENDPGVDLWRHNGMGVPFVK